MNDITLSAQIRTITGKKVKQLRRDNIIPAVLYGHKIKPKLLAFNSVEFNHVYIEAGTSTVVKLNIKEEKDVINTIIHQIDKDPVSDKIIHADLMQIRMDEKIKTEIPVILEGAEEAPVVKEKEGSIISNKTELTIEALPNDLIHEIKIDVSTLSEFDQVIHVKDIKTPPAVTILDEPDEVVVSIQEPRSEEELAELEEEVKEDVETVEVEKKGKEEVEGEEGETTTDETSKAEETDKKE